MTRTAKTEARLTIKEQECLEKLETLTIQPGHPVANELARQMRVSIATAYRLLRSLQAKRRIEIKETVTVEVVKP